MGGIVWLLVVLPIKMAIWPLQLMWAPFKYMMIGMMYAFLPKMRR